MYSLEGFASALLGDLIEMVLQESGAQIGAFAVLCGNDEYVVHVVARLTVAVASCRGSVCVVRVAAVVCKMESKTKTIVVMSEKCNKERATTTDKALALATPEAENMSICMFFVLPVLCLSLINNVFT